MSQPRRMTDDFLAGIAHRYSELVDVGRMPAPAIAEAEGVPVRTVHRWVYEARKRGMLPPGTPAGLCGGAVPKKPLGGTGDNVRHNVKRLREGRHLTYVRLSGLLADHGRPMPVLSLRRIEAGERRVDVDDLAALAAVFSVTPAFLLEPPPECGTCRGAPPPGFTCTECDTTSLRGD